MSNSDPTLFERLAKVEPAKLARLLVELAEQDQTILEQVQLLLASGDTAAIAKAVRSTLRAWKRSLATVHPLPRSLRFRRTTRSLAGQCGGRASWPRSRAGP